MREIEVRPRKTTETCAIRSLEAHNACRIRADSEARFYNDHHWSPLRTTIGYIPGALDCRPPGAILRHEHATGHPAERLSLPNAPQMDERWRHDDPRRRVSTMGLSPRAEALHQHAATWLCVLAAIALRRVFFCSLAFGGPQSCAHARVTIQGLPDRRGLGGAAASC